MILCSNPRASYVAYRSEIDEAIARVLNSERYILGPEVAAFEKEFAAYLGTQFGLGVASGTDALWLALRACGIGPGDEVITVAHTAVATVTAIEAVGALPVLVDIDPQSFTLDPNRLEAAVTPKTKAIVPVHVYGHPADMPAIMSIADRYNVRVIEDCAQAHGAAIAGKKVGTWGDIASFSFYPTKNLGAVGDGGMVVTADSELAQRVRHLREYGWEERYVSATTGWNSRLDELQAALLRVKLKHLPADTERRRALAALYSEVLAEAEVALPQTRRGTTPVWHLYVVRVRERDAVQTSLRAQGIGALIHYPVPIHLQPAYRDRLPGARFLPATEAAAAEILSLPLYPELTEEEVRQVGAGLRAAVGSAVGMTAR